MIDGFMSEKEVDVSTLPSGVVSWDEKENDSYAPQSKAPVVNKKSDELLSFVEDSSVTFSQLVGDLSPGGFKLFESGNTLIVLIRLEPGEKPEKLFVFEKTIEVQSSLKRALCVDLPHSVDMKSGRAQVRAEIISVTATKI